MTIEYRLAVPYAVICKWVSRQEIPAELPPLIGKVHRWLQEREADPAGPPFFEYRVMNPDKMHVCVGFPLKKPITGDEMVHAGAFPEGEYAVATHIGYYSGLFAANEALNGWFKTQGYRQRFLEKSGPVFSGSRTEFYFSDPTVEKDESKWRTEIAVWVEPVA